MKLYEVAKVKHPDKQIIMVNNLEELKGYNLSFNNAVVASGTSTSILTISEITKYLQK